jgi:tRNA A37 threonylcarbamoyladenosine modification protein TsaB
MQQNNLYLDTTGKISILILFNGQQIILRRELEIQKFSENRLLEEIDALLKKSATKISELDALIVNVGPGSFTGTRSGVAFANALKMAKPELKLFAAKNPGSLEEILKSLSGSEAEMLVPFYYSQPSITKPKQAGEV